MCLPSQDQAFLQKNTVGAHRVSKKIETTMNDYLMRMKIRVLGVLEKGDRRKMKNVPTKYTQPKKKYTHTHSEYTTPEIFTE